jgi:hypothetical protein
VHYHAPRAPQIGPVGQEEKEKPGKKRELEVNGPDLDPKKWYCMYPPMMTATEEELHDKYVKSQGRTICELGRPGMTPAPEDSRVRDDQRRDSRVCAEACGVHEFTDEEAEEYRREFVF